MAHAVNAATAADRQQSYQAGWLEKEIGGFPRFVRFQMCRGNLNIFSNMFSHFGTFFKARQPDDFAGFSNVLP